MSEVKIDGFSFSRKQEVAETTAKLNFGGKDKWTFRVKKNQHSFLDAFVTLVERADGSMEPIEAVCFCYYMDTIQFTPGEEVQVETTGTGDIHIRYLTTEDGSDHGYILNGFVIYRNIDVSYIKRTDSNLVFSNRTDSSRSKANYFVRLRSTGDLICPSVLLHSVMTNSTHNVKIGEEIRISTLGSNNMEAYVCYAEKDLTGRRINRMKSTESEYINYICDNLSRFDHCELMKVSQQIRSLKLSASFNRGQGERESIFKI